MSWYPKRLPKSELPTIQKLVDDFDYDTLFRKMLEYKLTDQTYCCPEPSIVNHFQSILDFHNEREK